VRARNSDGTSDPTQRVYFICDELISYPVVIGQAVPLQNLLRQSVILRIDGYDVKLRVFWQPGQQRWFATVEIPIGNPVVSGKGIVTGSGLLEGLLTDIKGDFVCRAKITEQEPGRNAWGGTHVIRYEIP